MLTTLKILPGLGLGPYKKTAMPSLFPRDIDH